MGIEMTAENPFMLSVSKHVPAFFNSLFTLDVRRSRRDIPTRLPHLLGQYFIDQ